MDGHDRSDGHPQSLGHQVRAPSWVTVSTGMFGKTNSFLPIQGTTADGERLVSSWDKDKVKGAPQVIDDADGYLTPQEERELYRYYGYDYDAPVAQTAPTTTRGEGHDTSGPNTDEAMTRSEEQVRVGVEKREAGRARLRKYVVTEIVTQTAGTLGGARLAAYMAFCFCR